MTHLTVPIAAKDFDQAAKQIKAAIAAGAEMLELRTDYLENLISSISTDHNLVYDGGAYTKVLMTKS